MHHQDLTWQLQTSEMFRNLLERLKEENWSLFLGSGNFANFLV